MSRLKYQSSRLFNILTLIILIGLCLLLNSLTKINFHRLSLPKDKPEFSATGFQANLYASTGNLLYQFNAESGIQFPNSDRIQMETIKIQAFVESTGELAQQMTSNDGWVNPKLSTAFLGESVELIVANKDPKNVLYAYTKDVNLDGIKKIANSSAPIRATYGKSILTGIGFSVDYDKKQLTIESKVEVIYAN